MSERSNPSTSPPSPNDVRGFRHQLTVGVDVVDPLKWFPASYGVAPRVRLGGRRWFNLLWLLPLGFVFADIGGGYHQDHAFFGYRQSI